MWADDAGCEEEYSSGTENESLKVLECIYPIDPFHTHILHAHFYNYF
jgi:hypothetical protein